MHGNAAKRPPIAADLNPLLPAIQIVEWSFLAPPRRPGDLGCLGPYLVEAELGRGGLGRAFLEVTAQNGDRLFIDQYEIIATDQVAPLQDLPPI